MVHALREARRVLKADGLLVDLRPAAQHCRVGILRGGRFTALGVARGSLDGARAADRAVSLALARRLFHQALRFRLVCDVVFTSGEALREWLLDFNESEGGPAEDRLVRQAAEAARSGTPRGTIAVRFPLVLRVFGKQASRARTAAP